MSGTVLSPWAFNPRPSESAQRLAKSSGCPTAPPALMASCLKTVPASSFKHELKQMMKTVANPADYFAPSAETFITDDTFMTKNPREILNEGNYSKIPLMAGFNSMEGLLYSSRFLVDQYALENVDKKFNIWIPKFMHYNPQNNSVTSTIRIFYFPKNDTIIDLNRLEHFKNFTNVLSDGSFVHPTHEFSKLYAKGGGPLYLYYNTYQGRFSVFDILRSIPLPDVSGREGFPQPPPEVSVVGQLFSDLLRYRLTNQKPSNLGPSHGDLMFLLFNFRRVPGVGRLSMDYPMSKTLVQTLVDFATAKDGDVLRYNDIPWPPIPMTANLSSNLSSDLKYMKIELPGEVVPQPFPERMQLWNEKIMNGES